MEAHGLKKIIIIKKERLKKTDVNVAENAGCVGKFRCVQLILWSMRKPLRPPV